MMPEPFEYELDISARVAKIRELMESSPELRLRDAGTLADLDLITEWDDDGPRP